jgi:hypothetical protein
LSFFPFSLDLALAFSSKIDHNMSRSCGVVPRIFDFQIFTQGEGGKS